MAFKRAGHHKFDYLYNISMKLIDEGRSETNFSFDHDKENKHGVSMDQNSLHFSSFDESINFILSHFQSPFDEFLEK